MAFPTPTTPPGLPYLQHNTRSETPSPRIPLLTTRRLSQSTPVMTTLVPNTPPQGYPVWAFICGYPWWPAKVVQLPTNANSRIHKPSTKDHDKILVEFFHDNKHTSFVPTCCLRYFPDYHVSDLYPGKKIPLKLQRAVNEAKHYCRTEWAFLQPTITERKPVNETGFRPVKRFRSTDQSIRRPFSISPSRSQRLNLPAATTSLRHVKKESHTPEKSQQDSQSNTHQQQTTPTTAMVRLRDAEIITLHRLIFDIRKTLPADTLAQLPQLDKSFGPVCNTAAELLGRCGTVFAAVSKFLKQAEQPESSPQQIHKQEATVVSLCRRLLAIHVDPSILKNYGLMYILKARELAQKSKNVSPEIHFTLCAVADSWEDMGGVQSGLSCDFDADFN